MNASAQMNSLFADCNFHSSLPASKTGDSVFESRGNSKTSLFMESEVYRVKMKNVIKLSIVPDLKYWAANVPATRSIKTAELHFFLLESYLIRDWGGGDVCSRWGKIHLRKHWNGCWRARGGEKGCLFLISCFKLTTLLSPNFTLPAFVLFHPLVVVLLTCATLRFPVYLGLWKSCLDVLNSVSWAHGPGLSRLAWTECLFVQQTLLTSALLRWLLPFFAVFGTQAVMVILLDGVSQSASLQLLHRADLFMDCKFLREDKNQ